jgi:hypothetical protein
METHDLAGTIDRENDTTVLCVNSCGGAESSEVAGAVALTKKRIVNQNRNGRNGERIGRESRAPIGEEDRLRCGRNRPEK